MINLIKTDFRRVLKDKLWLVIAILGAVFSLITPLLYKFIESFSIQEITDVLLGQISAKALYFESFSLFGDFGLIVPILLAIIIYKDFSFGTVRNKIICGNSRNSIFLSMFLVCSVCLCTVMLLYTLLVLIISLFMFDFQQSPFTLNDLGYVLASVLFWLLIYIFISALISWLCAKAKNIGVIIVLYVALVMGMVMITSILQIAYLTVTNKAAHDILYVVQRINVFNASLHIGNGTSYSLADVLYLVLPSLIGTAGFLLLAMLKFNKKDLK